MQISGAFSLLLIALTAAPSPSGAAEPRLSPTAALTRIESLLDLGRPHEAESLFTRADAPRQKAFRHRREMISARLDASRGNWKAADKRLRSWKVSPERGEGSGETFFWLGWSALHQGRKPEADSMLLQASAYAGEAGRNRAQEALEYRFAALLETSPALLDYLRGLPESPLPDSLRLASLARVPVDSRLHPYARWQLALLKEILGDTVGSQEILRKLSVNLSSLPGRRAAARLALGREAASPDSARSGYEALLLKQQQGISAETARKRLQRLRSTPGPDR